MRVSNALRILIIAVAPFLLAVCGGSKPDHSSSSKSTETTSSRQSSLQSTHLQAVTFGYDKRGRLVRAEYPNTKKRIRYQYDAAGNRTARIVDATISEPNPSLPTLPGPAGCRIVVPTGCHAHPTSVFPKMDSYNGSDESAEQCLPRAAAFANWCKIHPGETVTATYTQAGAASGVSKTVGFSGCWVSIGSCSKHADIENKSIVDTYQTARTDKDRCLRRARDYLLYCEDADAGNKVSATFYANGKEVETSDARNTSNGCWIDVKSCPAGTHRANKTFKTHYDGASQSEGRCLERAEEIVRWCVDGVSGGQSNVTAFFVENKTDSASKSASSTSVKSAEQFLAENRLAGSRVSIAGDRLIVGAPFSEPGKPSAINSGKATIFHRVNGGWVKQQDIWPPIPKQSGWFGSAVAIEGNIAAIGSQGYDSGKGAAYIYEFKQGNWRHTFSVAVAGRWNFGRAVSVSGDRIVFGCSACKRNGAIYVYKRNAAGAWASEATLQPWSVASSQDASLKYGEAVSIRQGRIIVGAFAEDTARGRNSGAAYIYSYNSATKTWKNDKKLVPASLETEDYFGHAVAIANDFAAVGTYAEHSHDAFDGPGRAYVFERSGSGWTQHPVFSGPESMKHKGFGNAVAINGDHLFIGAGHKPYRHPGVSYLGSAYRYDWNASSKRFIYKRKYDYPRASGLSAIRYGSRIALSGSDVAIAGPTAASPFHGFVHVIRLSMDR